MNDFTPTPDAKQVANDVERALQEDIGNGDISATLLPEQQRSQASILAREAGLLCGQAWVEQAFLNLDPNTLINWHINEGDHFSANTVLCELQGQTNKLVTAERTALNFLQLLCAVASKVAHYTAQIAHTQTRLLDTRKTIPGLRYAQKYAVQCGGGINHRMGLYDAFLIKENHIISAGSIHQAIANARALTANRFVEIEVENLDELQQALAAKPDRIMLDNFSISDIQQAIKLRQQQTPLEASGGITLQNLRSIAETGVDFISLGTLTKDITALDLSMRLSL